MRSFGDVFGDQPGQEAPPETAGRAIVNPIPAMRHRLDVMSDSVERIGVIVRELDARDASLCNELALAARRIRDLEGDYRQLEQFSRGETAKVSERNIEIAELKIALKKARTRAETAEADIAQWRGIADQFRAANADLEGEREKWRQERHDLCLRIAEYQLRDELAAK